jgi:hypothetical protein
MDVRHYNMGQERRDETDRVGGVERDNADLADGGGSVGLVRHCKQLLDGRRSGGLAGVLLRLEDEEIKHRCRDGDVDSHHGREPSPALLSVGGEKKKEGGSSSVARGGT